MDRQPILTYPDQKPLLTRKQKAYGAVAGATAAAPALLYTRGLHRAGVPLRRIPQVFKRDIAALGTHQGVSGSLGGITSTMRQGFTGTGGDIASASRRVWSNVKGAWGGLRGLNARLDSIINFEEPREQHKHPSLSKLGLLYGAGGITGAGVATGSTATRAVMRPAVKKVQELYKRLRKIR